jgi:TonB family protein
MRIPFFILFSLILSSKLFSQELIKKEFFDSNWILTDSTQAAFYKVTERENTISDRGTVSTFDINSTIISYSEYASLYELKRHGQNKRYDDSGALSSLYHYEFGELNGSFAHYHTNGNVKIKGAYFRNELMDSLYSFYESGTYRRKDFYLNGKLVSGNCYKESQEDTVHFAFDVEASYYGGTDSMQRWIQQNLVYPQDAIEFNEQGRVYVSFIIEKDGSVSTVRIERGVSQSIDQEVKRLISAMPKWVPGEFDGYKTRTKMRLPINFTLDNGRSNTSDNKKKKWWRKN